MIQEDLITISVLGTVKGNLLTAVYYCQSLSYMLSHVICSIFLVSGFKNSDPDDYQRVVRNCDVKVLNNFPLMQFLLQLSCWRT